MDVTIRGGGLDCRVRKPREDTIIGPGHGDQGQSRLHER